MSTITKDITLIINTLRQGGIAAIPTETVYGLAGNAEDEGAIAKIYALKQRPLDHPLIMHVAKDADLSRWVTNIPDYVAPLIAHFWPGPLTLVLPCRPGAVNPKITGGQATVAIRSPKHPLAQQLLSELAFPLVAPSANPFGKISPTTAAHVQASFKDQELLILEGGRALVGIESTIVAAINPRGYQILRQGVIDEDMLRQILPGLECEHEGTIRSSGNLERHYQPEKPLYYFTDKKAALDYCEQQTKVFVLTLKKNKHFEKYATSLLSDCPKTLAYELYFQLRHADASSAETILIELPPDTAVWKGTRERIMKAGKALTKENR